MTWLWVACVASAVVALVASGAAVHLALKVTNTVRELEHEAKERPKSRLEVDLDADLVAELRSVSFLSSDGVGGSSRSPGPVGSRARTLLGAVDRLGGVVRDRAFGRGQSRRESLELAAMLEEAFQQEQYLILQELLAAGEPGYLAAKTTLAQSSDPAHVRYVRAAERLDHLKCLRDRARGVFHESSSRLGGGAGTPSSVRTVEEPSDGAGESSHSPGPVGSRASPS